MAKYAIMPAEDYLDACNATREKTGGTDPIKSGELGGQIRSISGGDTSVEDALITRTLTEYSNDRVTIVGDCAFYGCDALISVNLPLVTDIGREAFYSCDGLIELVFPAAKRIQSHGVSSCSALTVLDLPVATTIQYLAIQNCPNLVAICLRNVSAICALDDDDTFYNTPIKSGTGYFYVPAALVEGYRERYASTTYAAQFRALEDYTVDGTVTGKLDMSKI